MQVLPATAHDPGYGVAPARNETPSEYNRVGSEYLNALHRHYGDPAKMWGAYNWGPGNLDNALSRYGADWLRHAPKETQDYVRRNMAGSGL